MGDFTLVTPSLSTLPLEDNARVSRPTPSSKNEDFEKALNQVTQQTHQVIAAVARQGGQAALLGGDNQDPMRMTDTLVNLLKLESDGRTQRVMNQSAAAQEEGNRLMRMGVAASLIGKSVDGEAGILSYDGASGKKTNFKMTLPPYLKRASFVVADHAGSVLNEYALDPRVGPKNFEWDGKVRDGEEGGFKNAEKGVYRFGIRALGHDDQEMTLPVYTARDIASADTQRLVFFDATGQSLGGLDSLINLRKAEVAA